MGSYIIIQGWQHLLRQRAVIANSVGVALCTAALAIRGLRGGSLIGDEIFFFLFTAAYLAAGAVLVVRRPDTAVSWVVWGAGTSAAVATVGQGYFELFLAHDFIGFGHARLALFIGGLAFFVMIALAGVLLPLLFPTGRPPTPAWWWVIYAAGIGVILTTIAELPSTMSLPPSELLEPRPAPLLNTVGGTLLATASIGAIASLIVRFRRADAIERLQLKWFLSAGAIAATGIGMEFTLTGLLSSVALVLLTVGFTLMPVAIATAVLRYRLYEIDRVISRTLAFAVLTVLLSAVYSIVVLVLSLLFGQVAAGAPNWTVAGATLAAAALFQPARHRVQREVDRHFNRRSYDAVKVIAAFGGRLRQQLDRDALASELLTAVDQTIQPATRTLWLRPHARDHVPSTIQIASDALTR